MNTTPLSRTLAVALGLSVAAISPAHAGSLSGKITFSGTPKVETLKMDADPVCKKAHGTIQSENEVVGPNGGLKNVFVYVKEGLEGKSFDVPKDAVVLDQIGCQYKPHVIGVMAKQKIEIINSDDTLHNVHPTPKDNREWNLAMPFKGQKVKKSFREPEIGIPVQCNVHSWMKAYICVVANPYYAVSGDDGTYTIKDLPDGTYTIAVWQEELGEKTAKVTVSGDTTESFSF